MKSVNCEQNASNLYNGMQKFKVFFAYTILTTLRLKKGKFTMEVIVEETGKGKFSQTISVGDHTLQADEPKTMGGEDLGPSPYEFILAGLGACTSMTIRMYANHKKIALEKIIVKLTIEKNYAKDCENCENKQSRIDHIIRTIELTGNLDDTDRKRLLEIANRCPVHRTLTHPAIITTQLT